MFLGGLSSLLFAKKIILDGNESELNLRKFSKVSFETSITLNLTLFSRVQESSGYEGEPALFSDKCYFRVK